MTGKETPPPNRGGVSFPMAFASGGQRLSQRAMPAYAAPPLRIGSALATCATRPRSGSTATLRWRRGVHRQLPWLSGSGRGHRLIGQPRQPHRARRRGTRSNRDRPWAALRRLGRREGAVARCGRGGPRRGEPLRRQLGCVPSAQRSPVEGPSAVAGRHRCMPRTLRRRDQHVFPFGSRGPRRDRRPNPHRRAGYPVTNIEPGTELPSIWGPVIPTLHPAYVLCRGVNGGERKRLVEGLGRARQLVSARPSRSGA